MVPFKIKHIYHSGFHIEFENYIIMFDVFTDLEQYQGKKIYCFATHSHRDHFHPDVLKLGYNNDVTYILSDDIKANGDGINFVKDGDDLKIDHIDIHVFGTTDLGVSFCIKIDDYVFFHSGDLNWWHWENDVEKTQLSEKSQYQNEVNRLKGIHVNYAFVPVDPRLKSGYRLAMDYFIDTIKPDYLIPMHFGDQYDILDDLDTTSQTTLLKSKIKNSYL